MILSLLETIQLKWKEKKEKLAVHSEIKDLGFMRYYLGLEVARSKNDIMASQYKYILDLLKETR